MLSEKAFIIKNFKLKALKPYEKQDRDDLLFSEIAESLLIFGGAIGETTDTHRVGAQKATLSRLYGAIQEWWGDQIPEELEPETETDSDGPEKTEWLPTPDDPDEREAHFGVDDEEPDEAEPDESGEEEYEVVPAEPVVVKAPRKMVRRKKTATRK